MSARPRQQQADSLAEKCSAKILFVDQTAQMGGAELCLKDIVLARAELDRVFLLQHGPLEDCLVSAGIDVQVVVGRRSLDLRKHSGLWRKVLSFLDVWRIARRVAHAAVDFDVIYANTPKALVVSALAGRIAGKPVIYHMHDIFSRDHFSRSNLWLLVVTCNKRVAHVIANSNATLDAYTRAGGRTACTVCYNGFDPISFDERVADRTSLSLSLRTSLRIETHETIIAVFGRLAAWKGQHVAINALRRLPGIHLLLVGDALFGEFAYKQELLKLAKDPTLGGRVHFLGFRNDVAGLMQACDIVVHCSTSPEPFGRVIVEAMLSRRPVVASRAGGATEIVEHGITGLLAEPDNDMALAECIRTIAADEGCTGSMVTKAYAYACSRFGLHEVVTQINHVVCSVTRIPC